MSRVFQKLLKYRTEVKFPNKSENLDLSLNKEEDATIRYVAGFIVVSIRNVLGSTKTSEGKAVAQILDYWRSKDSYEENDTLLEYSKKWVNIVNRGGLHHVSDDFFKFIRAIELVARQILNKNLFKNYKGENLRKLLIEKFKESEQIDAGWSNITRHIANKKLKEKLLKKIFSKWVNIRATSFIKCWIQVLKRKSKSKQSKASEKGQPSLRKSLATNKPGVSEQGEPSLRKTLSKK